MIDGRVGYILTTREKEFIKYEVEKQACKFVKKLSTSNCSLADCQMTSQNLSLTKDVDGKCIHNTEEAAVLLNENCGQHEFEDISPSVTKTTSMQNIHEWNKNVDCSTYSNEGNKCELYIWYVIYFGTVIGVFWFAIVYVWVPMIKAIMDQNL